MCFWIGAYQLYPFLFMEASVEGDTANMCLTLFVAISAPMSCLAETM